MITLPDPPSYHHLAMTSLWIKPWKGFEVYVRVDHDKIIIANMNAAKSRSGNLKRLLCELKDWRVEFENVINNDVREWLFARGYKQHGCYLVP